MEQIKELTEGMLMDSAEFAHMLEEGYCEHVEQWKEETVVTILDNYISYGELHVEGMLKDDRWVSKFECVLSVADWKYNSAWFCEGTVNEFGCAFNADQNCAPYYFVLNILIGYIAASFQYPG